MRKHTVICVVALIWASTSLSSEHSKAEKGQAMDVEIDTYMNEVNSLFQGVDTSVKSMRSFLHSTGLFNADVDGQQISYSSRSQGQVETKICKLLGQGGSKMMMQLEDGNVLYLPNYSVSTFNWQNLILNELAYLKLIQMLRIPTLKAQAVRIKTRQGELPSYITRPYSSLGKQAFVMEPASGKLWPEWFIEHFEKSPMKWLRSFVQDLSTDYRKIVLSGILLPSDAQGIIFLGRENPWHLNRKSISIRPFLSDFAVKGDPFSKPEPKLKSEQDAGAFEKTVVDVWVRSAISNFIVGYEEMNLVNKRTGWDPNMSFDELMNDLRNTSN